MFLNKYNKACFLTSMVCVKKNYFSSGKEIALVGYSNVGKSSIINSLTKNNKLSKVSKTPGKTKMINFFGLSDGDRLVDLPGYGYAKVSKKIKQDWDYSVNQYLLNSVFLMGVVVCMDIRHVIKDLDKKIINLIVNNNKLICLVLTKSDLMSNVLCKAKINIIKNYLSFLQIKIDIILFSSRSFIGVDILQNKICKWFEGS
ncbi:MAG: ribosome biogenesis GTP-binding protein YihA/YsxC [Buchnera aphidicola (Eriosoma harunire)]